MKDSSGKSWQLAAGAGKDSNLYIVNRNSTGKFNPQSHNIYQELPGVLPGGIWSMPVFLPASFILGQWVRRAWLFQYKNAQLLPAPVAQTGNSFAYPGATPSNSANKRPERYRLGLQAPSGGAPRAASQISSGR
jgi:hypothetical protein